MIVKKKLVINGICVNRKVRKMTKLNPTTMKTQYDGQYDTFCRKNHDYGNSFEESLDQFGIIASLVRMQDKMLRLQSLTDESKTQQVGSESLLDTLEDLSNYAAMTACWLKGVQAEDDVVNKSFHAVKDLIEKRDDSDVKYNELYHKRMLNSLYGAHIFRTPGENWQMTQCENGFKPLGAEIETIGMYIDRMLSELYSRIDVWGYNDQEQYHEFVNFAETTVKEIIKNNVPISELQKHIDVFPNFSQAYKNSLKSQCMKEYNKVEQVRPNKEDEKMKKLIEASEEVVREEHDHSDIVDIFRYNMQAAKDTMKFWRKPGTPFTPLGPEIVHEPQLPEALYNYIKENVDDCVNRIHQLSLRGSVITKGGLENFTYNLGRVAMDHYEDPQKIIEHIGQIPSFGSLDDKQAQMVVESVKEYIHDFIKEKEAEPINKFVETSAQYNDVEKEIDALLQKLFRMTENRKGYFATIEYLNDWNSIIIEISNIVKANNISDSHLMDLIFPYTRLESNTILYQVNRNKSSHNDIVVKTDNLEFQNKPVGIWKPLGSEVVHEFPYIYKIGDCGMEHTDDNVSHDDATDFLEKQINCAVGYMNHARAHGKIPLTKDIGIYVYNIAQYALEQYTNPHRIVQHMGKILTTRSLNPNDALLLCSSVTDCIRNITNKEKGCNKAKAKDKASANKVIVMASRGSGKGLIKARSLLKELGIPEEDIKEIFEGLEEEDDE